MNENEAEEIIEKEKPIIKNLIKLSFELKTQSITLIENFSAIQLIIEIQKN